MEKRSQPSGRISWGTGRVFFKKHLPFIQQQIEAGSPLTAVYERIKESLAGMSYNAFTYHARKHFASAVIRRRKMHDAAQTAASSTAASWRIAPSLTPKSSATEKTASSPGKPAKFRPGPRIPDPRDLY